MRGPSSFKAELAAYRRTLVKERAEYPRLALALQVLDRWRDHAAIEAIWKTIKENLPHEDVPTAEQLINLVLQRWDTAINLNERIPEIPDIENQTKHQIKHHSQKRKYGQIAQLTYWLEGILDTRTRLLGRQGTGQKQFMKAWSESFQELGGKPLDQTVAWLTEIAFDGVVTVNMVRRARRDRSTQPPQ